MRTLLAIIAVCLAAGIAPAHEVRPAFLQLTQTSEDTFDVVWKVPMTGGLAIGLEARLPEGCEAVGAARSSRVGDAVITRWTVRHEGAFVGESVAIDGLARTPADVLVRIERLDGSTQVARLGPSRTSLVVEASPGLWQVAWTYLVLGVEHILLGIDHLLFVLALLLLVKGWRKVVETITAFTIAHSITLGAAALGLVHVPGPPVEAIIALSIVFVASEILRARRGKPGLSQRWPWIVAFSFGLLHGLGFAGALAEIGLPQKAIPLALLCFNVGVEVGQLLFIAAVGVIAWGALAVVKRLPRKLPEGWQLIPPYAIGGVAMFWVIERVAGF